MTAQGLLLPRLPGAAPDGVEGLTAVIQEAYIQGISTRAIDDLVKAMGMSGVSTTWSAGGARRRSASSSLSRRRGTAPSASSARWSPHFHEDSGQQASARYAPQAALVGKRRWNPSSYRGKLLRIGLTVKNTDDFKPPFVILSKGREQARAR